MLFSLIKQLISGERSQAAEDVLQEMQGAQAAQSDAIQKIEGTSCFPG